MTAGPNRVGASSNSFLTPHRAPDFAVAPREAKAINNCLIPQHLEGEEALRNPKGIGQKWPLKYPPHQKDLPTSLC